MTNIQSNQSRAFSEATKAKLETIIRRIPLDNPAGRLPDDLAREAAAVLREGFFELGYTVVNLSKTPGGSSSGGFLDETHWLFAEENRADPREAISRLEELVVKNEVVLQHVMELWGLHPDKIMDLAPGLSLFPITQLPFEPKDYPQNVFPTGPRPRAALVREFLHRPLYFQKNEERSPFTWEDKYFLTDLALALVLLNDSPVVRVAQWYQADPRKPIVGRGMGRGGYREHQNVILDMPPESYDEIRAREIVTGFLKLTEQNRRRMLVALRRLNLTGLSEMASDIAVDLGIAIEALLTEEGDPTDSMAYRLKLRAAILMGETIEERESIAAQVSELYALRSYAAHGSDMDGPWREEKPFRIGGKKGKRYDAHVLLEVLTNGRKLCGRIARKILNLGAFPDYRRMMLTTGSLGPPRIEGSH
jgi:hypothetical protein